MINTDDLTLEAKPIAIRVVNVLLCHTEPWAKCILCHGSGFKGGIIPHCSDIDFRVYVRREVFEMDGTLPIPMAIELHRDLSAIDPDPFSYIQIRPIGVPCKDKLHHILPGTYKVLWGKLPVRQSTEEEVMTQAEHTLASLRIPPFDVADSLMDHGDGKLERTVRLLCTTVWPAFYSFGVWRLRKADLWTLPKDEAMKVVSAADQPVGLKIMVFYESCVEYYVRQRTVENALAVIHNALEFLTTVKAGFIKQRESAG